MRIQILSFIAATLALAGLPAAGQAAPQILGLAATETPLPLQCADGVCSVEVSGMCLQEHRSSPDAGTAYRAVAGADITLMPRQGKGQSVAVARQVEIVSLRTFSAVSVRLPESVVRDLVGDPAGAALSIGPLVSAVPVAVQGDPNPLSAAEIQSVTGPLRAVAERAATRDSDNWRATQTLLGLVNRLPDEKADGAAQIAALRDEATAALRGSPAAAQRVSHAFDRCRAKLRYQVFPHLRACLGNEHDLLNTMTTQSVWRALQPGS